MSTSNLNDLNVSSLFDLSGRVTVVTGGGTGIGLMIAKGLSANGAKVYVTGRREEVLNQVHLQYPDIHPLRMDVSSKEEIANAVKILEEKEGKLDILVNNAGVSGPYYSFNQVEATQGLPAYASAEEKGTDLWSNAHFFNQYNFQDWASVFNINTTAPFFVTMAFLDLLKKGAAPGATSSVIMISSIAGGSSRITYHNPAYQASKVGVERLAINLATEFARNEIPIRVNAIAPGFFPSELTDTEEGLNEILRARPMPGAMNRVPLRRGGTEKEMASTAIYLASSMSGYSNGNIIAVDGGLHLVNP